MVDYRPRVVDAELRQDVRVMGAVPIDGPKAVVKTMTASQIATSVVSVDVDRAARAALEANPEQLFALSTPTLFGECQETREL